MAEEEPEGIRMATGGIPAQEWEIATGLTLEKRRTYGVSLYVDYVTVKIGAQGRTISIDWGVAELFSYKQMTDVEEMELEHEVESILDSEIVPEEVEDEKGNMVKLTDEEREERARDLAEQSELEYGNDVLGELMRDIAHDDKIPKMFLEETYLFWSHEDYYGPSGGRKPENEILWMTRDEEKFLTTVEEAARTVRLGLVEDEPTVLRSLVLAVRKIMLRQKHQDRMDTLEKTIPVWSFMRLKYRLKEMAKEHPKRYKQLRERWEKKGKMPEHLTDEERHYIDGYIRLDQMRQWLKTHKTEMAEAARRMLDKKEVPGAVKEATKGKQLTVEMKRAKVKPRFNPDIADDLADYYHAIGADPEIPVDWLMSQGASPEQITEAADRLLESERIDPPDYWAITGAVAGADYHVRVPRGNPTATEELATRRKLEKAVREKHGHEPEEADKLFRKLRLVHKHKTDEEIMDMVREKFGLKKRKNPSFKSAREALKHALKHMKGIEIVEYQPYEPPAPEPTLEQSIESLEKTAGEAVYEDEGVEEAVKALEQLTAESVKDEWKAMFERERAEHPSLPEEVVRKIVDDHMAFKTSMEIVWPEEAERENPSKHDRIIKAFWDEHEAHGPKAVAYGSSDITAERRDEVQIRKYLPDESPLVRYMLWGNLVGMLDHDEQGHKTFSISTAGFDTNLTRDRLGALLGEGKQRYPILKSFDIHKDQGIRLYRIVKIRKPDPKKPWLSRRWDEIGPVPRTLYRPTDLPKGKLPLHSMYFDLEATLQENIDRLTGKALKQDIAEMEVPVDTLEEVQTAIDDIERGIAEHRAANRDFDSTPIEIAERLGTRERLEELLKQRDELMWRGNPRIPYTPPEAPDVEVQCPVTGKYTWSCTRCALFKGRSEQFIECKAKEGKRYYLAKARDKRGTIWDTYVLPRNQRKTGIETKAMGGD